MIISDTDIIEGIIGAIGTAIFYLIFTQMYPNRKHMWRRLALSFACTWFVRKISVNIYTQIIKPGGISIPSLRF
jgi:hypothetical protein